MAAKIFETLPFELKHGFSPKGRGQWTFAPFHLRDIPDAAVTSPEMGFTMLKNGQSLIQPCLLSVLLPFCPSCYLAFWHSETLPSSATASNHRYRLMANDLTPEHTARYLAKELHPDVLAANEYVDSVSHTADQEHPKAWYGWALREAFLAGCSHAAQSKQQPPHINS